MLFYLVSAVSLTVNTNTEKLQGVKGYFTAIALNAGDAILWLALQYISEVMRSVICPEKLWRNQS